MSTHNLGSADQISDGERLLVQLKGREIAVFNVNEEYHAYVNWCAHQAGPVCEGSLTGTMEAEYDSESGNTKLDYCKEGKILNCPWHGWEYDITSGKCLSRKGVVLPEYDVEVQGDDLILTLG